MLLQNILQGDYTLSRSYYQIKLPINLEPMIPSDDPVRRLGEVGSETVFIDGTKIEANANKYTFVWKKTVTKNLAKMMEKLTAFVAECEALYGLRIVYNDSIRGVYEAAAIDKMSPRIITANIVASVNRTYPIILAGLPVPFFSLEAIARSRNASKNVPVNKDSTQIKIVI